MTAATSSTWTRFRSEMRDLWGVIEGRCSLADVNPVLEEHHYLGAARRGWGWVDSRGVAVLSNPSSRRLPQHRWQELTRWCLVRGMKNDGSKMWSNIARWMKANMPWVTTVVSYSDPSVGHTGALYKASNWVWAPTWHRLRPPPSGNGSWDGRTVQSVKDRWVYVLRRDDERAEILRVKW